MTDNPRKVRLDEVRLSFSDLWHLTEDMSGRDCYRASFLFDPSTKTGKQNLKKCQAAIDDVLKELLGSKAANFSLSDDRSALKDGDKQISGNTGEIYDGYEGMMVLSAKNTSSKPGKKPTHFPIVGRDRKPLSEDSGKIYDGCYVNAFVSFYGVTGKEKGGVGVFATIDGIQFEKDGEPFSGSGPSVEDMFEEKEEFEEEDLV